VKITKITAEMLEAENACGQQVALFKKIFPDGAKLTRGNWEEAKGVELDVWFCVKFLSPKKLAEFSKIRDSAWAEYDEVCELARIKYDKILCLAWAEYAKVCGFNLPEYNKGNNPAWVEYNNICGPARAKYDKVWNSTWTEYEKVCVSALFALLESQE
jgi:hypothetical protein